MEKIKVLKLTDVKGWDMDTIYSEQLGEILGGMNAISAGFIVSDCNKYLMNDDTDMNINIENKNIKSAISMGAEELDVFYVEHDEEYYILLYEDFNEIKEEYSYIEGEMGAIFVNKKDALKYEDFVARAMKFVELASDFSEEEKESLLDYIYE